MDVKQNKFNSKSLEEDGSMKTTINKCVNFDKINFTKPTKTTEQSLKDVVPIRWADDILNGERKIVIKKTKRKKDK